MYIILYYIIYARNTLEKLLHRKSSIKEIKTISRNKKYDAKIGLWFTTEFAGKIFM